MSKILILGDDVAGVEIANWLTQFQELRVHLALIRSERKLINTKLSERIELIAVSSKKESEELVTQMANNENFLITCYWPWVLPVSCFKDFEGKTLNFHPALLPKDRGWYPHVHQIRNNSISGVTLHKLNERADEGDIWIQKEVKLDFPITSGEARLILQDGIIKLFKENWSSIINNEIEPYPQTGPSNYYTKNSVDDYNFMPGAQVSTAEDFLRNLASRNIGKKSFIQTQIGSSTKYIHIFFSDDGNLI